MLCEFARLAGALIIGGLAGALVLAAALTIVAHSRADGTLQLSFVPSNVVSLVFFFTFTAPVALFTGVPAFYVLRRLGLLGRLSMALTGATGSLAAAAFLGLLRNLSSGAVLLFGGAGLAAGLAAYAVLRRSGVRLELPSTPD